MISLNIKEMSFTSKCIFKDASIEINEGKFIGIKGESGAGKSTLLSLIGLLQSFKGEYFIDNILVTKKNREKMRKKYFGYVFQSSFLIPHLTVKENILEPLRNLKEKYDKEKYASVIELLGIKDLEDRIPETLSGGEKQRVAIARAVMVNRAYILVDEPTGSLDPNNSFIVMDCFKKIIENYKTTIIMVTHSRDFDSYFDEIYIIKDKLVSLYEDKD